MIKIPVCVSLDHLVVCTGCFLLGVLTVFIVILSIYIVPRIKEFISLLKFYADNIYKKGGDNGNKRRKQREKEKEEN